MQNEIFFFFLKKGGGEEWHFMAPNTIARNKVKSTNFEVAVWSLKSISFEILQILSDQASKILDKNI